jgi:hypothetical protein
LTRTLYTARRRKRIFLFSCRGMAPRAARGMEVKFGVLWFTAAEPGPEEQFCPYNSMQ